MRKQIAQTLFRVNERCLVMRGKEKNIRVNNVSEVVR